MAAFKTLWANHPNIKGDAPLLDKSVYTNQCAINVGAALIRSGVSLKTFKGTWSWNKEGQRYPIRAEELAQWLASAQTPMSKTERYEGKTFLKKMTGRTGIAFFRNYWGPGNQGDHIDLWNGSRLTHLISWAQIYARIGSIGINTDLRKAENVLFWPVL